MSVTVTLLCEDRTTDTFVRSFLRSRQFTNRSIRTLPLPHGKQSGEQWVREQYPKQLRAVRNRSDVYLLVVIDADNFTGEQRRSQLRQECMKQNVSEREADEPVIIAVPRRNIETWLAYLDGAEVGETEEYLRKTPQECRRLAKRLYEMCHEEQRLRQPVPPSLTEACEEYRKLKR